MAVESPPDWTACWLPQGPVPPDLAAVVRSHLAVVPSWVGRAAVVPWVPRAFARLSAARIAHMPPHLWRLIAFVVSQDQACRHCYGLTRGMLKLTGYDDALIAVLERDVQMADLPATDRLALDFARKVSKANPRPHPEERARLRAAGFSDRAIAEMTYAVAGNVVGNRVSTMLALPTEPMVGLMAHPVARLLRPLAGWYFRVRPLDPAPLPLPNAGPFAALVQALEGSPTAHVLRDVLDDADASAVLPPRTRLLMFGVIGRAMGCAYTERQVLDRLVAEGFTEAQVVEILANLASPVLDAREKVLVPFARETVRYRPADIQDRTRALLDHLSVPETVDAVGITALANGLCRLSILLDPC